MEDRVLGLDSGGTKTRAVVVGPAGQVLGHHAGEGLDPTTGVGWEASLATVAEALGPVSHAMLGLPFHGEIAAVSARQAAVGQALFGPRCGVVNDVAVAFAGAFAGKDGVLILSGTGSMAWARGPLGAVRVGGWGDAIGDEGSAAWIGRAALGLISMQLDGRRARTAFADGLLARLGLAADDLIGWVYGHANPRAGIAAVAAQVSALARAGDADAIHLLQQAGVHLATLGQTAARRSGVHTGPWSHAGGVFADETVLGAVTQAMGRTAMPAALPPVGGAVLMAARAAGWAVDRGFVQRLHANLATTFHATSESA
jgi:glucosamine kinase